MNRIISIFGFDIVIVLLTVLIIIFITITIKLVITNTHLKKQNKYFEHELETQSRYYSLLEESNKELMCFKHDFKNFCIGILKALSDGENEIVLEMIENAQHEFDKTILKFNTGNGIVDAILNEKQKRGDSCNIIINFEGMIPQNVLSPGDLCVIFGNILDNAIEACEKRPAYYENIISVSVNCCCGFMFISVSNPISERIVVDKNHIKTTKGNKLEHGFGLYSIRKIVKKYNGEMNISLVNDKFTITIDLCL